MAANEQAANDSPTPEQVGLINRELSWLAFNGRVLEEAFNQNHPLFERVNFLSISGSNLDEFYMVRVAGLRGQLESGVDVISDDGLTPAQQLEKIAEKASELMEAQDRCWAELQHDLRAANVAILSDDEISDEETTWLNAYFNDEVLPVLSPLAIDPAHPFPFIPNGGFSMFVALKRKADKKAMECLLPIPPQVDRFIRLPGDPVRFVALETVIRLFLGQLFPGHKISGMGVFRVLRDSEMEIEEEAEDLVRVFESALKRRRRGHVILLTISSAMPEELRKIVIRELRADEKSVMIFDGVLGIRDLSQIITKERRELRFKPYNPRYPERVREFQGDIFAAIKAKDFVIHHPYESFDVVHRFLAQAAQDPDVVAIKQLLYRTGEESPIVDALVDAAERGKSVTALVELKARFDEEVNIKWARDLERAGVQVVFGFIDLKTHGKVSMVVRRERKKLKTYVHFGTGNYQAATARVYTDLSFFTADKALARDASRLFNYVTGYIQPPKLEKIAMSPFSTRDTLMALVDDEIENALAGKPAQVWAKMNALVDKRMIEKLYEASQAGVQIDLIVRGVCCLRPGIKGLSENIRVKSIVGRYLEHARIVAFANGAKLPSNKAKVFISSADWMPRNFDHRIETLVPIENKTVHEQVLKQILVANIKDNTQSWTLRADGTYVRTKAGKSKFSAHDYFMTNPSLSGRGAALREKSPNRRLRVHSSSARRRTAPGKPVVIAPDHEQESQE